MKSSLQTIQTLAKIAKVLCKIAFVFCIVGAVGCLLGICSLALGIIGALKIGGVTIHGLIEQNAGVTLGTMYASMAAGLILCTAEAFLAEIAGNYFRHVLEVGTPFTTQGADELKRLGIWTIVLPLVTMIVASIVCKILTIFLPGIAELRLDDYSSVALGVGFLVVSVLCRYGAEALSARQQNSEQ